MKPPQKPTGLKRPLQEMPEFVENKLKEQDLMGHYSDRPPYQRNDYLSWIDRAVRDETKQKRLDQMLRELESGGVYMGMPWHRKSG